MSLDILSEHTCHGGIQGFYRHVSKATGGTMSFGLFRPAEAAQRDLPVLYFLAGLTCTAETAAIKAGAQAHACRHGLILVTPDTSPRDTGIEGATGDWEFGEGAGFYLDASAAPFSARFRMETYITAELPSVIAEHFRIDATHSSICGHSMGGHGALTLALKHPGLYRSVSAFAPIVAPTQVPWGQKALPRYLGDDPARWAAHDSVELIRSGHRFDGRILIDQGEADAFLESQLRPHLLEAVCADTSQALTIRRHAGYDHSYWFIQSFIEDHFAHHAAALAE